MSDLQQQLPVIERLRAERDTLGQKMYALRTDIARTGAALRRSRVASPRRPPPEEEVRAARAAIAADERRLRDLAAPEQAARAAIARVEEERRHREFLRRSLEGLRAAIAELRVQLAAAEQIKPIDRKTIAGLQAALESAEARAADTEQALAASIVGDAQRDADADAARQELGRIAAGSAQLRADIQEKEREIGTLRDASGPGAGRLADRLVALNQQYATTKGEWKASRDRLHETIKGIYVDPHPRPTVGQMPDTTPFLLLPVRIETRFVVRREITGPVGELLVRIYPDDVAVHTHESELTDREVGAGEAYWRVIFEIEKGAATDAAVRKAQAWKTFAVLFGPSRSAWVARQTRPTNWAALATVASADALTFPVHDFTKTSAWSRAPRTHVLPDRFVVMCYQGDTLVEEVVGEPIPDELQVGPEPLDLVADADQADAEDSFVIDTNGQLTFGGAFDWASNFDRAVEQGMGVRIPISGTVAVSGYDRIVVLGVLASASADAGKGMLETLLANHHHSPNGLTLLRQGAATNNMEGAGSGYSVNDALDQTTEVTGLDAPLATAPFDTDGRRLAEALGIGYGTFQHVFNADNGDHRQAVAMNRALYPATLGYYFDTLLPVLPDDDRDRLREFFVANVTGRGPLAPIRIGDQPYGLLLTSDFAGWSDGKDVRGDGFPGVLLAVLRRFDALWQSILPKLSWAGKPGTPTAEVLLDVLGLQASSVTFAQRVAYDANYLATLADFTAGDREYGEFVTNALKGIAIDLWLRSLGAEGDDTLSMGWPPLLRLIFQHYTTGIDAANLIDAVPLSETAPIREYTTNRNYLHWLRDVSSLDALAAQNFGGAPVPTALLYLKLRHALLLQLHKTVVTWLEFKGYNASATMKAKTFHNIRQTPDLSRWELMGAPVSALGMSSSAGRVAIADYVMAPEISIDARGYLEQMRQALDTLATMSTARLERCFAEHIDACTYRLDAWQTGLFKTRLDAMRNTAQPGGARRLGTYLGAFGWVENVRPSASWIAAEDVPEQLESPVGAPLREYAGNGGFIHAPSINHATAAALLRSGYMSHATPENPEVMKVNVSSERVRRALFILQGLRHGQSIEALLGYQFERGIHDRGSADPTLAVLNGFIFDIRIAFPIKRVRLEGGPSGGAEETVEAYDIVNGLTLAETANPDWATITGAPSTTLTPIRIAALNAERDKVADTLDAIKDLLLSESAYQLVQGNFDRAGAVLGSIKDANVPPDLDVIRTPRSSQFTFTQRVAIHVPRLDPLDPAAAAWPTIPMTPRALLEPGLNRWFGDVLGAPDAIVLTAFEVQEVGGVITPVNPAVLTLEDLDLQPIDLVYIVGSDVATGTGGRSGGSELESRVAWRYRADHSLNETSRIQIQFSAPKNQAGTATVAEVMPLVHALQTVLSDSRPLDARDYQTSVTTAGVSATPPATGFDFDDLRVRADALRTQLVDVVDELLALPFTAVIDEWPVASLGEAFDVLRATDVDLASVGFTFPASDALALQGLLLRLSTFGMPDAFPRVQDATRSEAKAALVLQAMDASAVAGARVTASARLLADAIAKLPTSSDQAATLAMGACKAILGESFTVLPVFALANEADLLQSAGDTAQLLSHAVTTLKMPSPADEWIRSVAYVRPKIAAWERIRLLHETLLGTTLDLTPVQLPYRPRDSWLGVALPDTDPVTGKPFDIARDTASVVTHGAAAFAAGSLRCGVLVDSWTETIPAREQSTGIAFHYNRPDAMPPQAILLAVPPQMTGNWSWDALVQILNDTLRRAKLRAVEPHLLDQRTGNPELGVLLPAIISEFQQYDLNISLDLRLNLVALAPMLTGFYLNPNLNA